MLLVEVISELNLVLLMLTLVSEVTIIEGGDDILAGFEKQMTQLLKKA